MTYVGSAYDLPMSRSVEIRWIGNRIGRSERETVEPRLVVVLNHAKMYECREIRSNCARSKLGALLLIIVKLTGEILRVLNN